jgi:hypothetical protein
MEPRAGIRTGGGGGAGVRHGAKDSSQICTSYELGKPGVA